MRPSHRLGVLAASAGLLAAALTAAPTSAAPPTTAAPAAATAPAARTVATIFAMSANGHGTSVRGGQLPTSSGATAFSSIGCTNRAGIKRTNYEAEVTVPGLGVVRAVRTGVWTAKSGRVVSSTATHRIAQVVLADSPLGKLTIEGVRSLSRAYHDGNRFRTQSETQVAKIVLTPPVGDPQVLPIPTPGQPLVIPGLARISVGNTATRRIPDGIRVVSNALDIVILPTDTRIRVAHTASKIQIGAPFGTFGGFSAGVRAKALANNVKVGRTPVSLMPCIGTKGEVEKRALATIDLAGQAVVQGLHTEQMARQRRRFATGYELGRVAGVNLGGGQLVVNGIVGKVRVTRKPGVLVRNTNGTTIGSIVVNGETQSMPPTGVLEIPGLAKLEDRVVTKTKYGITVVALRITLLDGTGAVIDLGVASLRIHKG